LTPKCYEYSIADKNNEGQDASLRLDMGNVGVIQEECLQVAEFLGIKGASFIQMKRDKEGVPKIIEVNPRLGGGTILTTYAGVNFPELIIKMANAEKIEIPKLQEITMIRYYEEVILNEKGEVIYMER